MRVGIIGAGSIGLLFAAYLSRVFDVTVYTRSQEQAAEINQHNVLLQSGTEETIAKVKALPIADWQGSEALTIIAVKQYQLFSIIERLSQLPSMPENILFLQNGMGHLKLLDDINTSNLFVGSVEHGALKENPYTVRHNGIGTTNVAVYKGDPGFLKMFVLAVSNVFPITFHEEYFAMMEKKLIANAMINPLTAILQVNNGALIDNPFYYKVLQNLFSEITAILNLEHPEGYWEHVIKICKKTRDNRSSMLKDIEAKRLTEVDAILGYLLEEANKQGKKLPQLETLYYLIKGIESQGVVI
ncbi:2-dehydropantoate 2-reductase [Neobacillus bataviensis]|uniref:2-dehydropantoate 2-reductase n=1 Tax=Neobacillus bataviensis TaxID=220685 RepID=A0A561E015_9BACI|nr:2-dehydropantoate 2-reductase [Neobacillus bataviensis]TWE08932.1 2-dehydropantoate 2-reductase [Neobacillus bataviensis]